MNGTWKRLEGFLGIPRFSARVEGAALSGSLELRDLDADPLVDLSLEVERVDFARLLRTSGWRSWNPRGGRQRAGRPGDGEARGGRGEAGGRIRHPSS
jgi:hypothetical protein